MSRIRNFWRPVIIRRPRNVNNKCSALSLSMRELFTHWWLNAGILQHPANKWSQVTNNEIQTYCLANYPVDYALWQLRNEEERHERGVVEALRALGVSVLVDGNGSDSWLLVFHYQSPLLDEPATSPATPEEDDTSESYFPFGLDLSRGLINM